VRPVLARRLVPRPRDELYALLADLRGHWQLAGRWVHPIELRHDGGVVQVRGPGGLRRTVITELTRVESPGLVAGEARSGATRAAICWELEPSGSRTLVTLRADIDRAGPLDRALLALGGRRWLAGRFARTLQELG
jgi:hypothetical protein